MLKDKRQEYISSEINLLDARIKELTLHLQQNPKDYSSQRGLYKILSKRRRLIRYIGL
uniref:Small ribosomal subunit protein uS15c n=1 Tax=prasinophyte sp. MBIC10622 TaxID=156113 RepID=A0A088CIU9_9CHLO|nr:ribosomal protein S15 [prasinophyte sp. MBIC10622]